MQGSSSDGPRRLRDPVNDEYYDDSCTPPSHQTPSPAGSGGGEAGTRAGLGRGRWAPLAPASGVAVCPQGPREPVSLTGTQAWSPVPLGASSVPTAASASGRGLWRSRGSSGRAGFLLPATGPASAPLPGVRPEQGGQGAIGWGASALHLEVGSQGGVLARAPLRGGLGIVDPNHVFQDEHSLGQNLQGLPQLLHPLALGWRKPWGQGRPAPESCPSPPLPSCHHHQHNGHHR